MVPESRARSGQRRYDPFGAVSITAALLVFVYAISHAPQVGWAATQTVAMLAVGAALLVAFLVIETRAEAPLLPLPLLRRSAAAGPNAVGFLLGTSFLTFVFIGTLYMQQVLGYSALETGAAWMAASLTSFAFAGLSQKLVTRTSASPFGVALTRPWPGSRRHGKSRAAPQERSLPMPRPCRLRSPWSPEPHTCCGCS